MEKEDGNDSQSPQAIDFGTIAEAFEVGRNLIHGLGHEVGVTNSFDATSVFPDKEDIGVHIFVEAWVFDWTEGLCGVVVDEIEVKLIENGQGQKF